MLPLTTKNHLIKISRISTLALKANCFVVVIDAFGDVKDDQTRLVVERLWLHVLDFELQSAVCRQCHLHPEYPNSRVLSIYLKYSYFENQYRSEVYLSLRFSYSQILTKLKLTTAIFFIIFTKNVFILKLFEYHFSIFDWHYGTNLGIIFRIIKLFWVVARIYIRGLSFLLVRFVFILFYYICVIFLFCVRMV